MPLRDSAFAECAKDVLDYLINRQAQYKHPDQGLLEQFIYNLLTRRDSIEVFKGIYSAYFRSREGDYEHEFELLDLPYTATVGISGMWFSVRSRVEDTRQRSFIGMFKITHNEYFTFCPTSKEPQDIYNEIVRFVRTLPHLHEALHPLSVREHDSIQIMIPNSLRVMLNHPDSLVVHYRSRHLGQTIRKIVTEIFDRRGIRLTKRIFRADSGFDFEHSESTLAKSHSELLSRVMAKKILNDTDKLLRLTKEEFAEWLKQTVSKVSSWDIGRIHNSL